MSRHPSLPSFRLPPCSPSSSPPTTPKHRRASLADDITIVGGNRTGIFVSHVRAGSPAEQCGLKEGSELLEVCMCMCELMLHRGRVLQWVQIRYTYSMYDVECKTKKGGWTMCCFDMFFLLSSWSVFCLVGGVCCWTSALLKSPTFLFSGGLIL